MRFSFTEDQELFQKSARDLMTRLCPPEALRSTWENDTGRLPEMWENLGELGILGMQVPEEAGGMGLTALDQVLVLEECGKVGLPEPLVAHACGALPLLAEVAQTGGSDDSALEELLEEAVSGSQTLTLGTSSSPGLIYGAQADAAVIRNQDKLLLVKQADWNASAQPSVDRSRRVAKLSFDSAKAQVLAEGEQVAKLWQKAEQRMWVGHGAFMLGLSRALIDITVEYVKVRKQFGKPIGSFQALKHKLADCLLKLEFARPVVYRAAYSLAHGDGDADTHCRMAKAYANDAAALGAKHALQCHGAIGYSFECDLHLFLKRAWALSRSWGDSRSHRLVLASRLLDG